jgi:hypothetical protein
MPACACCLPSLVLALPTLWALKEVLCLVSPFSCPLSVASCLVAYYLLSAVLYLQPCIYPLLSDPCYLTPTHCFPYSQGGVWRCGSLRVWGVGDVASARIPRLVLPSLPPCLCLLSTVCFLLYAVCCLLSAAYTCGEPGMWPQHAFHAWYSHLFPYFALLFVFSRVLWFVLFLSLLFFSPVC